MAISRKRAPIVQDPQLSRIVSKIYDDINEVINAVNSGDTSVLKSSSQGKSGDIRVVKDSTGIYYIEARTDEGWIQSDGSGDNDSGFKFREKE